MKICILGTHGTGKTTIVNTVYNKIINDPLILTNNIAKIDEIYGEVCKSIGQKSGATFQTQTDITFATYYKQMATEIIYSINKQDYVCDRSPLDCFVYQNIGGDCQYAFLKILAYNHCMQYDKIYLIEPSERAIEDNGFRNTSKADQLAIHNLFLKEVDRLNNVVIVNQEQQNEVIEEIINLFKNI